MKNWMAGCVALRKYPTAKITAHTIRTPITYTVRVFKDFSRGRLGGVVRSVNKLERGNVG
jgi:hypothetical protein